MKILVASDIHGSAFYCKQLCNAIEQETPERILLLGDLLYHGPRNDLPEEYAPKEVIAMLNGLKHRIIAVRGNCDTEVDQMVLEFPIMADYALICLERRAIYATHGHVFNENNLPSIQSGDILLNGHTHIPAYRTHNDYTYINPGSVSVPKNNSAHSYMILENSSILWKSLDGGITMQAAL